MFKVYGVRLVFRMVILIAAIQVYLNDKTSLVISRGLSFQNGIKPVHVLWLILAAEMLLKFFPQRVMSIGCRKQFKSNYVPSGKSLPVSEIATWMKGENESAKKVFMVWLGINGLVAVFYYTGFYSEPEMLLLSLLYYGFDLFVSSSTARFNRLL